MKTLIIGLGTTGCEIVSYALDRMLDRFDSLDRVPWVQFVGLDTAELKADQSLRRTGNSYQIGLPTTYFAQFRNDEESRQMGIDTSSWAEASVFRAGGASLEGAGLTRMIGRASMLHPKVFAEVDRILRERLTRLRGLNLAQALQTAGVAADGVNGQHYTTFVVGGLAGGTSSGSFIDIGYYLEDLIKQFSQEGDNWRRLGLFSLPHGSYAHVRKMANVYAALRELDHYSEPGTVYRQRFSTDVAREITSIDGPFTATLLTMPPSIEKDDIKTTHAAAAEILISSAIDPQGNQLWERIIDPHNETADYRHASGARLNYLAFGSAALVYPAKHVARGCAYRLAAGALDSWLGNALVDPSGPETYLNQTLRLTQDGVRDRLLRPFGGGASLEAEMNDRIEAAALKALKGDLSGIQECAAQCEEGFESASARGITGGVGPNRVNATVFENHEPVRNYYESAIAERLTQALHTMSEGPAWCRSLLAALKIRLADLDAMGEAQSAHERVPEAQRRMKEAEAAVDDAKGAVFIFRGAGLASKVPVWKHTAGEYWRARREEACGAVEPSLFRSLQSLVDRAHRRLDEGAGSLTRVAAGVVATLKPEVVRLRDEPPVVNGYVHFVPKENGTIDKEYGKAVNAAPARSDPHIPSSLHGEALARAWIMARHPALEGCLTNETSIFDGGGTAGLENSLAIEAIGIARRDFFATLPTKNVLEEIYGPEDASHEGTHDLVRNVWVASRPGLDFSQTGVTGIPQHGENEINNFSTAYAYSFHPRSEAWPYARFRHDLPELGDFRTDNHDPTRATVLRTRVGISAAQITALAQYARRAEQIKRLPDDNGNRQLTIYSRKDVVWRNIDGKPLKPNIVEGMGQFLLAIALRTAERSNAAGNERYLLNVIQTNGRFQESLPLSNDVELAAYVVLGGDGDGDGASAYVRRLVGDWAERYPPELARKIADFVNQQPQLYPDLRYRGEALRRQDMVDWMLVALNFPRAQGVDRELWPCLGNQNVHIPTDRYWRMATDTKPEGYYCDQCGHYFTSEPAWTGVPEVCPNCGHRLLVPGFHRRFGYLEEKLPVRPLAGGGTPSQPERKRTPEMPGRGPVPFDPNPPDAPPGTPPINDYSQP